MVSFGFVSVVPASDGSVGKIPISPIRIPVFSFQYHSMENENLIDYSFFAARSLYSLVEWKG